MNNPEVATSQRRSDRPGSKATMPHESTATPEIGEWKRSDVDSFVCMQAQWSAGVPQSACWAFTTPSKAEPCEGVLCARTALDRARASECWLGARRSISMRLRRAASFGRSVAALACRATRFASAATAKHKENQVMLQFRHQLWALGRRLGLS